MSTLPRGWSSATASALGQVQLGRQRSPEHHNGEHMRPYLRVANVFEDRIDTSDVLSMNFTPEEYERYALQNGDILLNEGQSKELVGRPAIYRGEVPGACFQNTLVRFRVGPALLPEFALAVFRHYLHTGRFAAISKWTTSIAHLGAERFAALELPVPPLAEQRRIVAKLDSLFASIRAANASLQRVPEMFDRLRNTTLIAAFRGELIEQPRDGRMSNMRSNGPFELPQDWRWAKFGEVARVASNLVDPGEHPSALHIAPNHIESNWGRLLEHQTVKEDGVSSPKHRFKPGQILYSKIRPYLAKATLVDFSGLCSADMYPVETELDATFLLFWMLSPEFTHLASQSQGRTVLPKINQAALNEIPVPVPPSNEQHQIGCRVRAAFDRLTILRERASSALRLLNYLEDAALAAAVRGELVSQDPNDEPASVLLERIRAERAAAPPVKSKRGASPSTPARARTSKRAP